MKRKKKLTRREVRAMRDEALKLQTAIRGTVVIGSNADYGVCELCGAKDEELRPYGANGENICYSCGMKNRETTEKKIEQFLNGKNSNT